MKILLVLLFIGSINLCIAQEAIPKIELSSIPVANQGNSYITFPLDIGNIEPLWFEANVIPNFLIRKNKSARLMGVLTPQIIIRMYQKESLPMQTPMPEITSSLFSF
jgi:hypothetical protein